MLMLLLTLTKYASQGREQEEQKRKSRWPKKIASMTDTTSLLSSMFISIGLYIVQVERKLQEVHLGSIVFLLSFIAIIEPIVSPTKRGLCTSYIHLRTYDVQKRQRDGIKIGIFAFA